MDSAQSHKTLSRGTKVRFSRALKEAKLCLSYHKTSRGVFTAFQFTLWVVKVWTQANVYLENRILLLWFAKALKHFIKKNASFLPHCDWLFFLTWLMITLLYVFNTLNIQLNPNYSKLLYVPNSFFPLIFADDFKNLWYLVSTSIVCF